jgi:hypothetical protein
MNYIAAVVDSFASFVHSSIIAVMTHEKESRRISSNKCQTMMMIRKGSCACVEEMLKADEQPCPIAGSINNNATRII